MIFGITHNEIILFSLILARVSSAMMVFPIFGSNAFPIQIKISLSLLLSIVMVPILATTPVGVSPTVSILLINVCKEIVVGVLLGFLASMMFAGIELAGQLIAVQMGFGMVNIMDPQAKHNITIISQIQVLLASMIFLAIDGHHFLLDGLNQSFAAIPPLTAHFQEEIFHVNMKMASSIFLAAVKIGAPVIVSLLLTSIALGLTARVVPQMNVFIVGIPLKIGIGLAVMAFSLPLFAYVFQSIFMQFKSDFFVMIGLLGR